MNAPLFSSSTAHLLHLLFEWAALAVGMQIFRLQAKRKGAAGLLQPGRYAVVIGCILGAAVGNKLVFWIEFPHLWRTLSGDAAVWMSGQSIVGGLLGGLLGVELAKKIIGARSSTGDQFVLPLLAGTLVGRTGCFLAGLNDGTYGNPTTLPWGVDFSDGIARHPTQIYDMLFVLLWGGALLLARDRLRGKPGLMFKLYLAGYLLWRLWVDGLKPVLYFYAGQLSGIQLVCIVALVCYLPFLAAQLLRPVVPTDDHDQKNPPLPVL